MYAWIGTFTIAALFMVFRIFSTILADVIGPPSISVEVSSFVIALFRRNSHQKPKNQKKIQKQQIKKKQLNCYFSVCCYQYSIISSAGGWHFFLTGVSFSLNINDIFVYSIYSYIWSSDSLRLRVSNGISKNFTKNETTKEKKDTPQYSTQTDNND